MSGLLWRAWVACAALLLAGCSSLSSPGPVRARALDYLNDDVASLVLAFDMPQSLEPTPDGSVLSFHVTAPGGEARHIEARLVRADAGDIAGMLPAPQAGRTYYLFAFADADKAALRQAQAWARALPPGSLQPNSLAIGLVPRFCAATPVDPAKTRFAVLLALPASVALEPLVPNEPLAAALGQGEAVPACAGHSG